MKSFISLALIALCAVNCNGVHQYASTIRPPAFPLAVRAPYSNFWLNHNALPGNWPSFWTTEGKGWTGFIRVDGNTYTWMGRPGDLTGLMQYAIQKKSYVTPTQTIFVIQAGPVDLTVTFLSPVEPSDIERQSIPLSYIFISAEATDGASHKVEVYMDVSAEMASSDENQLAKWSLSTANTLKTLTMEMVNQQRFAEFEDYAQWGQFVFTTSNGASHIAAEDVKARRMFVDTGKLDNTIDTNFRCVKCQWPVVAFAHDLGQVSTSAKEIQITLGHVREENINLRGVAQKALWTHYFNNVDDMIRFFWNDAGNARVSGDALDDKILNEAFAIGGQDHADIIAFSLRQAVAGTEFSGNKTHPMLYQKEISSNGNMQTVDVMYPAIPMWYYLNVTNLQYILEPLFYQMESGFWPKDFSMHDIGFHYPNATGHDDGEEEDMPVEESANMILMVANIVFHPKAETAASQEYVRRHFKVIYQWAEFLFYNCLYPVNQLTTDDFIGHTELNSGLALKGILGMKAFARLAEFIGETNATTFYNKAVSDFVPIWVEESTHNSGTHLKMEYNVTDGYQFKYNAYQDRLLGLNTVPEDIYVKEAAYYLTKEEFVGIPFVSTHDYTKSDWEMWTAASFGDFNPTLKTNLVAGLARFLRETPTRQPFGDWFVTATGEATGFKARPVVGGHFALMARNVK